MADFVIPTSTRQDRPHYTQRTTLDGTTYVLALNWNGREKRWMLSIRAADGTPIAEGLKVVIGWPLNRHVRGGPPGMLWAVDTTGAGTDPGLQDLGSRVRLIYTDAAGLNG